MSRSTFARVAVVACLACLTPGCSSNSADGEALIKAANASNVHRLTNLYSLFALQHRGQGPKDEKEFRDFIAAMGPERLGRMGIKPEAIEALFSSERDSQPFIIRYERKGSDASSAGIPAEFAGAVVLEAKGIDGTRQAGFVDARGTRQVKSLDAKQPATSK